MQKRSFWNSAVILALLMICLFPASAQVKGTYAAVGFMGLSPVLADALASYSVADTLYGGTVSFSVKPWFTVGADVLYLGDVYYGKDSFGAFSGPASWTKLSKLGSVSGAKANWKYFESLIYAPLTFNLTIPLGFMKPYIGAGPAFYFHFPSTNEKADFTAYMSGHYGDGQRIRTGLTARAGLDILLAHSFSLGVGYIVREDLPAKVFEHLADPSFFLENGYAFLTAKVLFE
ncbi:MAG: hypothetical protein NT061_08725 [Spirochaetes bacterium]|nr:hypothetical protein [Spirochaetota bacterium]